MISTLLDPEGRVLLHQRVEPRPVLDPRVAYLVLDLLQDAMNRGTGAGSRARGFTAPAAGKTGTSRDGWFIGFTSNLLAAVWIGFDDARDLGLPGSASALPVWTAFMKRAVVLPQYRNLEEFIPPEGIVAVPIDPETLAVAVPECPVVRTEKFLVGTEPHDLCPKHRPSGFRSVTRTLLRAIGLGRDGRRPAEPPPVNPSKPAADKKPDDDEFEEIEVEVEPRRDPEGPGMLRRAASSIGAAPLRVIKRIKKKKNDVKEEASRE